MYHKNPVDIQVLGNLDIGDLQKDIAEVMDIIKEYDDSRNGWIEDCKKIRKLIEGKQKRKNLPWKGASQMCVPLIKKMIRRWKPVLYNLVALADPVCSFYSGTAQASDQAPTAERFFDWMLKVYMDGTLNQIQYLLEYIGRYGSGYLGVAWDYETELQSRVAMVGNLFPQGLPENPEEIMQVLAAQYEINPLHPQSKAALEEAVVKIQQGEQYVRVVSKQVIKNKPKVTAFSPMNIIVPPHSETCHDAEYVAIVNEMTACEMRQKAADGFFIPEAVERRLTEAKDGEANNEVGPGFDDEILKDAGVSIENDNIPVYQVYCKLDYNGDGIKERVVAWISPKNDEPVVLALFPFSFSIPHWPIFRFDYEKSTKGPYTSQGIGHLLKPLQEQLNKQYRAKSDAIDIQLAPVYQRRVTSGLRNRNIKWGPGVVIDVQENGDIGPVEKSPSNLHEYLGAEQQIEGMAENLIGSLVNDLQATGRKLERRTATEVQQVSGNSQAMSGMDSASFQDTIRMVWQAVWQMWMDLGPREIYFHVTGKKTPDLFKKADYDKNYQLMPTGTPGNTDRQKQLSFGMQILQIALQDPSQSINLPVLTRWIVKNIDDKLADVILIPEAQKQYIQALQHAASLINSGQMGPDVNEMLVSGAQAQEEGQ